MKEIINPPGVPAPVSAYNHALRITGATEILRLSGQVGQRPDGGLSANFAEQAEQAWANVDIILRAGGMSLGDVVKVTSYIVGREHIPAYVKVHSRWTASHRPPWTLLLVAGLGRPEFLVEIDVEAMR